MSGLALSRPLVIRLLEVLTLKPNGLILESLTAGAERVGPNLWKAAALEGKLNLRAKVLAQECTRKKLIIDKNWVVLSIKL